MNKIDKGYIFEYDRHESYEENFNVWRRRNNRERESFGLEKYTDDEAIKVFDEIFINIK